MQSIAICFVRFRTCFSSCFSLLFLYCLIDAVCLSVVALPPSLPLPFVVAAAAAAATVMQKRGECCRVVSCLAECRVLLLFVCVHAAQ